MEKDLTTEQKIKEAAKVVFLNKGFEGCSSREIAKAAGMNVALVNYYFRSKSQLFSLIFNAAMEDFVMSMIPVFNSEETLEEKMRIFIGKEFEFLLMHPDLPNFIINEMNRSGGCSVDHSQLIRKVAESGIFNECIEAQQSGSMRKIDVIGLTLLIMSNCQFPIMARRLIQNIHSLSDEQYLTYLDQHQQNVTEMLIGYLFPKSPNL
jgi:TetR/AcrR family transcriptional regulator